MGHLLANTNPEAAARINSEGRPLPGVGEIVRYHPRAGEVRQGRTIVPAIVTKVDEQNRLLEVVVVHHSDDLVTQDRLAEHVEGDRGWSRMPSAHVDLAEFQQNIYDLTKGAEHIFSRLSAIFGDFTLPEGETVMSLIDKLDERLAAIEETSVPPKVKAVTGRNRRRAARG